VPQAPAVPLADGMPLDAAVAVAAGVTGAPAGRPHAVVVAVAGAYATARRG
jgi:hypothetical protein